MESDGSDDRTVASSRTRMLLGVRSARAIDTSCRCPWLKFEPRPQTAIRLLHGLEKKENVDFRKADRATQFRQGGKAYLLHVSVRPAGLACPRHGPLILHGLERTADPSQWMSQ
jgi:hypothetical protein